MTLTTTAGGQVIDHREYVWNMLEEIGGTKPYERPADLELLGRCNALEAIGFIGYDEQARTYDVTCAGRAFIGGLYGGKMGRENPYRKEPERTVWDMAAELSARVKVAKRRRRGGVAV